MYQPAVIVELCCLTFAKITIRSVGEYLSSAVFAPLRIQLTVITQLAKLTVGKLRVKKTMCSHGARGSNLSLGFLRNLV
jgi:hypothetical protein